MMRLGLSCSQALGHLGTAGTYGRAENGVWAHKLDLARGQGRGELQLVLQGEFLAHGRFELGLDLVAMAGRTERPSTGN